jgi:uncharacterized protein with von Willebrand factor type A (vWA) domain
MRVPRFNLKQIRSDLRERFTRVTTQAEAAVERTAYVEAGRHVVVISRLDEYHFGTLAERWPKLKQLTVEASDRYAAFGELLQDLFYSLYLAVPRLRTKAELLPSHRVNADLMHQIQGLDLWRYSREHSRLNEGAAMIGTVTIATEVLKGLPEEAKDESQQATADQDEARKRREELQQALKDLMEAMGDDPPDDPGVDEAPPEQDPADAGEDTGDDEGDEAGEESGSQAGGSQSGRPRSTAQDGTDSGAGNDDDIDWDFLGGDKEADEGDEVGDEEGDACGAGDETEEELSPEDLATMEHELEDYLDALEAQGQALESLDEPEGGELDTDLARRIARNALTAGEEKLKGLDEAMTSWGVDPKDWNQIPIGDRLEIAEKLTAIPALKEFADEIGRMRQDVLWAMRQPGAYDAQEIVGVTVGGDVNSLLDVELMALVDPDLEMLLYARLAMEEVLEHEYIGRNPSGRGPFIVITDISGSMEGIKERWAKAFIIAALEIARKDNRNVAIVFFDTVVQEPYIVVPGGNATLSQKLEIAERGTAGGTDWRAGLEAALVNIEDEQGDWTSADVVLVTDGIYQLPKDFEARYTARCKEKGIRTHGVLLDCGAHHLGSLQSFCDQAWAITTLRGVGEANPIFRSMALKP